MTTTAVKERPILFSGPMVRAIRDGRKTQTRRAVKPQPPEGHRVTRCPYTGTGWSFEHPDGACYCKRLVNPYGDPGCFDGEPGDRLWVREAHKFAAGLDGKSASAIAESCMEANYRHPWAPTLYAADRGVSNDAVLNDFGGAWGKSRPSIHMPRWASRILLEITGVKAERLQSISEADKAAEGATPDMPFGTVWRQINTAPGIRWEDDPWVWAIEFCVLEGLAR